MKRTLASAVTLAVAAATHAGCYWAVPSCEVHQDDEESLSYAAGRLAFEEGDAFSIDGHRYPSCVELCLAQSGVERVASCSPPVRSGNAAFDVTCRVDRVACDNATIFAPRFASGRPFEGFASTRTTRGMRMEDVGGWLAEMARLEAASVPAFERLARELAFHEAPRDLVARARGARLDEIRHARVMTRLARRFGATPRRLDVPALPTRSLVAFATENAVVGCVHETLAASLAGFQAERAEDPTVRRAMAVIARDELRHGVLAWDILAWSLATLPRERANITAALAEAAHNASPASWIVPPAMARPLGLPDRRAATRMLESARAGLFALRTSHVVPM